MSRRSLKDLRPSFRSNDSGTVFDIELFDGYVYTKDACLGPRGWEYFTIMLRSDSFLRLWRFWLNYGA